MNVLVREHLIWNALYHGKAVLCQAGAAESALLPVNAKERRPRRCCRRVRAIAIVLLATVLLVSSRLGWVRSVI